MRRIYQILKNTISKKMLAFYTFSILIIPLSGCWDLIELNDLAIITAVAIDKSDDGQIELAAEIFIPKSAGGNDEGGGGGSENESFIIYNKGTSLADALSNLQAELPRKDFWGACKVFIFSDEIAKGGIQNHLDFLLRHSQTRESALAFVSKGTARDIIKKKSELERFSAIAIHNITTMGKGLIITLKDLDEMLMDETQGTVLPYITLREIETRKDKVSEIVVFTGAAIFNDDKMVGAMSESTTRGLLWLRNEREVYTMTFKPENKAGEISLFPEKTHVKLTPKITNDEWKMIVNLNTEGTIVQNETTLNPDNPKSLQLIKKAYRKKVKSRLKEALNESQRLKVDVVHFGKEFHRKHPKEWKKVKNDWEELFPDIKVEFVIETNIRRQGYIDEPMKTKIR